ncbi:hypothetical protein [Natronorubrum texcoconense]|uniref:Uncharacterized protein n=1 Tax=Natronorubrum texcoconense TaxID=1095776 RepID=A0A1G8VLC3_9EURY|nr:hypothetical protein [Natronorubrum texcoconense]SDJ66876.1 hypothetical protein SAMN04515672_1397 [Natronorubrum texcoconense]
MTSFRDLLGESLAVGEQFCLRLEERDGTLVADHPHDSSPMDIAVVEGLELLEERPPSEPVLVELLGKRVGSRIAGRVVGVDCNDSPSEDDGN